MIHKRSVIELTIIKLLWKWFVWFCWTIFPRDAINLCMIPFWEGFMLNFFSGETWKSCGVDMARVRTIGLCKVVTGWAAGVTTLFFLKLFLLSNFLATLGDTTNPESSDCWSSFVLSLLVGDTGGVFSAVFNAKSRCSFLSSISRFSTSLISAWIRSSGSSDRIIWNEWKIRRLNDKFIFQHSLLIRKMISNW